VIPTVLLPLPWPACSFSSNSLQVPQSGWFLTTHYLTWNSGILNILTLSHFMIWDSSSQPIPMRNSFRFRILRGRIYICLFPWVPIQIETNNVQTGLDFSQCSVLGSNSGSLQSQALIASINNAHTNPTFFNNINSVPTPNSAP